MNSRNQENFCEVSMFLHQIQESFSLHPSPDTEELCSHYPQQSLQITNINFSATNQKQITPTKTHRTKTHTHTFTARNLEQPFDDLPINDTVIHSKNMELLNTTGRTITHKILNSHFPYLGFSTNTFAASNVWKERKPIILRSSALQLYEHESKRKCIRERRMPTSEYIWGGGVDGKITERERDLI